MPSQTSSRRTPTIFSVQTAPVQTQPHAHSFQFTSSLSCSPMTLAVDSKSHFTVCRLILPRHSPNRQRPQSHPKSHRCLVGRLNQRTVQHGFTSLPRLLRCQQYTRRATCADLPKPTRGLPLQLRRIGVRHHCVQLHRCPESMAHPPWTAMEHRRR